MKIVILKVAMEMQLNLLSYIFLLVLHFPLYTDDIPIFNLYFAPVLLVLIHFFFSYLSCHLLNTRAHAL